MAVRNCSPVQTAVNPMQAAAVHLSSAGCANPSSEVLEVEVRIARPAPKVGMPWVLLLMVHLYIFPAVIPSPLLVIRQHLRMTPSTFDFGRKWTELFMPCTTGDAAGPSAGCPAAALAQLVALCVSITGGSLNQGPLNQGRLNQGCTSYASARSWNCRSAVSLLMPCCAALSGCSDLAFSRYACKHTAPKHGCI